jgi:cation diffusion facilitator CzcD-associated flavoprotein CzcO
MTADTPEMNGTISLEVKPIEVVDYDVVIIGAGISGINMAYRVQTNFPDRKYVILEARKAMGGTWDLMKYPGIRSDSDLHTFGFAWKPWTEKVPIAEGAKIVNYLKQCSAEYGIDKKIEYRHKVKECRWQSREQRWTLSVEATGEDEVVTKKLFRGQFIVLGTG